MTRSSGGAGQCGQTGRQQRARRGRVALLSACVFFTVALFASANAHAQADTAEIASGSGVAQVPVLRFADFFKLPYSQRGLELSETLKQADGKTVRLSGYMVQHERATLGQFMLAPRPVRMSEQADGDADDLPAAWVMVSLAPEQQDFAIPHQSGLIEVRGQLSVGRFEAVDGRVSWVRLQLAPEATRGMNAFEVSNYLHSLQHIH